MMPYLFKIGSFELRIYSLMIIIALLLTLYITSKKMKKMGYAQEYLENMIIIRCKNILCYFPVGLL